MVWQAILHTMPTIRNGLPWRINDDSSVRNEIHHSLGYGNMFQLPLDLVQFIKDRNINVIAQISNPGNSIIFTQAWISAEHLGIPVHWKQDWEGYITTLTESHVCIKCGASEIIWTPAEHGTYSLKASYPVIHNAHKPLVLLDW